MSKKEKTVDLEDSEQNLLQHPAYLTLLKDYAELKSKHLKLQEEVEHLEEKNRILEAQNKGEIFSVQIETLEKTINRLTFELHTSLETQEMYKKEYTAANKERESMVMKYAVGEKQLIDTQRYVKAFINLMDMFYNYLMSIRLLCYYYQSKGICRT